MNNEQKPTTYVPVIGLEVHVELKTNSKMFCSCSAFYFGKKPNTHTCPVCLGLPGALPVPNKKAIEWCVMIGLSLNCNIPLFSKFDRKNYFYPDLPKGYQISQYDKPFCQNGWIKLQSGKKIGITRVHMEEDTGKLIHEQNSSLVDFNRSGVPLVEIVTEPDFETAEEVKEYLQKLQQIVRYLGVSNADMEKGEMRLEPNISLARRKEHVAGSNNHEQRATRQLPPYKVEVKNINSFSFVGKAIDYEIKRQTEILENGKVPVQETRGFVEKNSSTITQRVKEEASDYRYFPEPDIPPLRWTKEHISNLKSQMPELPDVKLLRFQKQYLLSKYDSELLTKTIELARYFEEAVKAGKKVNLTPKQIANFIINKKTDIENIFPAKLIEEIINTTKKASIDVDELNKIIETVLKENQKAVKDYKKGKETVIMFLVGRTMGQFKEKVDAEKIKAVLTAKLK
ncbi:MAG: Asp-tRNA(Asn)/Glu-tRNA(Gln) amidotransferase subunit GatB [Patescibacteria group bacterium]